MVYLCSELQELPKKYITQVFLSVFFQMSRLLSMAEHSFAFFFVLLYGLLNQNKPLESRLFSI